jgi:hypothetical protein
MTTQTKSNPLSDSIETANERVSEFNAKAFESSKKAGSVLLDSYEKTVIALADSYAKAAHTTNIDWFVNVADAQADFTRDVTKSYASAARTLVR